jgi:protein-disulfide isomerase
MISNRPARFSRRISAIAAVIAAPLALAACDDGGLDTGSVRGEEIAPIPAPEGTEWTETITVSPEDGYVLGNPQAPLKVVEYASHTCGACANFSATAKPELKDYIETGVVSFEQRNLVRDPIDLTIATLVRCGRKENMQALSDQAWAALPEIFGQVQENPQAYEAAGSLPVERRFIAIAEAAGLIDFFAARGLSADQQRACLGNAETIERIAEQSSGQAEELGIEATPTFLLNGEKLDARQWAELEPVLQRAGARQAD